MLHLLRCRLRHLLQSRQVCRWASLLVSPRVNPLLRLWWRWCLRQRQWERQCSAMCQRRGWLRLHSRWKALLRLARRWSMRLRALGRWHCLGQSVALPRRQAQGWR
jgi:hypothetical protein